jgi:hypothetical protein
MGELVSQRALITPSSSQGNGYTNDHKQCPVEGAN